MLKGRVPMKTPNPGSNEALDQGCTCAVLDNHHGNMPDGNYWITVNCPLHGTDKDNIYLCNKCAFQSTTVEGLGEHIINNHMDERAKHAINAYIDSLE